ncbi:D-alanyl-D-alanine carboxypeptidase/D-alanyl-D-alanine endopeptidase [Cellulomonas edaphi]|uniref:D-alanyl-D-alanine carboxypeptidase/D-alanyl-D-alanine-endopeptidase n=1 Tax=Cellulomonas edaphi TaxID=3053468 RepID=A0ABT7S476_9CELL|nr:D-alanyl-D-alanine carboxypeptidase/D-alanyl-D-alanine-endopeptidase [Cellulomons edaphi]MDM7830431.1 D-alanyl-D-alanine carboxypeptidase/D-alanyl-D-alanine-endopeptidase [Cellulomons edaphi]
MATGARVAGTLVLVLSLAAGAYLTGDAHDVVPGPLTLEPSPTPPPPFPTAPGAVDAPDAEPALSDLDPQAPVPTATRIQALVDEVATDDRLGTPSHVGVVVTDRLTGDLLGAHLPDRGRTPASTAKLVTAVAALASLPADTTLPTRVVRAGAGTVVLVGGGDMMLAADKGDPDAVLGHAGLGDLARSVAAKLKLAGTTAVRVQWDDSLFSGPTINPDWDPADVVAGYVAPVTPLAVQIAATRPFRSSEDYPPRSAAPAFEAAKTFAARLEAAGITVQGTPTRGLADADAQELGVVRSAPLEQIVHYFLDTSDNTITEVVSRIVAVHQELPASFEGGTQAVLRAVQQAGVDTTGAHLADASGLARGSRLRPAMLADLVRLSTDPAEPMLRPVAIGMPIAGLTGTLADRFTRSPARGLLRAKTGSLQSVTALSGTVVDAEGRQLVFAVLADKTGAIGQAVPRTAVDAFATRLAACGCS